MKIKKQPKVILTLLPYLFSRDLKMCARYIFVGLLVLLTVVFDIAVPLSSKEIVKVIVQPSNQLPMAIAIILLSFGIIWTLAKVTSQFRQIFMYRVFERAIRLLGVKLFSHLTDLSMDYHANRKTGAIINAIDRAQMAIPNVFWGLLFVVIPTIVEVAFASAILWYLYGFMYGAVLLAVLGAFISITYWGTQLAVKIQRISNENNQNAGAYVVDRLLNYETLKTVLVDKDEELLRCDSILEKRENSMTKQLVYMDLVGVAQAAVIGIGITVLTFIAAKSIYLGSGLHVSDYVLISGYLVQFASPLGTFGFIFRQIRQGMTDLENVVEILDEKPTIVDKPNAQPLQYRTGTIDFDRVCFSYDGSRTSKVLNEFTLHIKQGQTVAVVGPTGSGKSTLAKLLMRFYDVDSGSIAIDGQDIRDYTQASLHAILGVVSQNAVLFNGSIKFNIAYSRPNVDKETLDKVIAMAGLKEFIASLKNGLDTLVGERGLKISGGERQRIAIARILLKAPRIFIFDEATSSLDVHTERLVQKNIDVIAKTMTTIIIAHRLSVVKDADSIVVLDKHASIVEVGQHQELLTKGGLYAQMWRYQTQKNEMMDGTYD